MPFCAFYHEAVNPLEDISHVVSVLEILDPSEHSSSDGLLCRAIDEGGKVLEVPLMELEVDPQSPNFALIEDYWYWAWNGRRAGKAAGW
ncbi:MAG: hypothetical protein HUU20_09525 [Pirellulales bacterium]|nr:hypothetical protein [Pirellulales bacterium]